MLFLDSFRLCCSFPATTPTTIPTSDGPSSTSKSTATIWNDQADVPAYCWKAIADIFHSTIFVISFEYDLIFAFGHIHRLESIHQFKNFHFPSLKSILFLENEQRIYPLSNINIYFVIFFIPQFIQNIIMLMRDSINNIKCSVYISLTMFLQFYQAVFHFHFCFQTLQPLLHFIHICLINPNQFSNFI